MAINIISTINTDSNFYQLLGPFLAQRSIAKELGGPLWDDSDLRWFIALDHNQVVGFCALRVGGGAAEFKHAYVLPTHRKIGVYKLLFEARFNSLKLIHAVGTTVRIRSVVGHNAREVYRKFGFTERRRTKNFLIMDLELKC